MDREALSFQDFVDFYELLDIGEDATNAEISKAFRLRALKYHPDKNKSPEASIKFMEYKKAQLTLLDPEARLIFDNVRKYRLEKIKREKQDSAERRALKKELLEKERLYRQEQEARIEAKLRNEMEQLTKKAFLNTSNSLEIKVKYRDPNKASIPFNIDSLKNAFLPYGIVNHVSIIGNCAKVEFGESIQNDLLERGQYDDEALQFYSIEVLSPSIERSQSSISKSSLEQMESMTIQRIRKAQEKKRSS